MNKKIQFEDAMILAMIRLIRFLFRVLPQGACFALLKGIGTAVFYATKRGRIAYKNVRMVYAGQLSRRRQRGIARRSIQNLMLSGYDFLRIPEMDDAYLKRHIRIIGSEKFLPRIQQGKGLIFLTAHFGCWELLNITGSIMGYPMVALARTQKHPRSDAFLNSIRRWRGSQIINKGMPLREILRSLRAGKVVGILSDQDGGANGCFVDFLGKKSSYPSGAATFAIRTDVPIYPVVIFRENGLNHRVEVEGPLELPPAGMPEPDAERFLMQQYAGILERKICSAPDQWLWAHRRWKSMPDRVVLILSDGKAGHLHQSAAALESYREFRRQKTQGRDRVRSEVAVIAYRHPFFKILLKILTAIFGRGLPLRWGWLRLCLKKECFEKLDNAYADLVISSGSSVAAVNALVAGENSAKSIVLMKPGLPKRLFDVRLVPRHDRPKTDPQTFVTEGVLSGLEDTTVKKFSEEFGVRYRVDGNCEAIGLLVGGDSGRCRLDPTQLTQTLNQIDAVTRRRGACVLVTTSRRTPPWAEQQLRHRYADRSGECPILVLAGQDNPPGTVQAILGLSRVVVVTGESMSMISEAVASARRVVVFLPFKGGRLKANHRRLLEDWQKEGLIVLARADNMQEILTRALCQVPRGDVPLKNRNEAVLRRAFERL